jgi:thioredoxin 1
MWNIIWKGNDNMLNTNLKHLETREVKKVLENNENVMVCCGRMGPMCIPVYGIMEQLEGEYSHVTLRDQDFNIPAADFIKSLPECSSFMGLPFTVCFKNGKVMAATSSIQTKEQIIEILDKEFGKSSLNNVHQNSKGSIVK